MADVVCYSFMVNFMVTTHTKRFRRIHQLEKDLIANKKLEIP